MCDYNYSFRLQKGARGDDFLQITNTLPARDASMRIGIAGNGNWSFTGSSEEFPVLKDVQHWVPKFGIETVTIAKKKNYIFVVHFNMGTLIDEMERVLQMVGVDVSVARTKPHLIKAKISRDRIKKAWAISIPWQQLIGVNDSELELPGLGCAIKVTKFDLIPQAKAFEFAGEMHIQNPVFDFRLVTAFVASAKPTQIRAELGFATPDGIELGEYIAIHSVSGSFSLGPTAGGADAGIEIGFKLRNLGLDGGGDGDGKLGLSLNLASGIPTRFNFQWPAKLQIPILLKVFTNDKLRLEDNTVFDLCYLDQTDDSTGEKMPITFFFDTKLMSFKVNAAFNLLDVFSGHALLEGSVGATNMVEADIKLNPMNLFGIVKIAGVQDMQLDETKPAILKFKFDASDIFSSYIQVNGTLHLPS